MTETLNSLYGVECGLPARLDAPNHAISFDADTIAQALVNIYQKKYGNGREIEPTLFEKTKEIFEGAISKGVKQSSFSIDDAFKHQLTHNMWVFSAFRTHKMQRDIAKYLLNEKGELKPFTKFVKDVAPYIKHTNRLWLETEYNTAVLRAHQAADWRKFVDERDVLPNLEWQPSTSTNPGEDHKPYWFTCLPIDHKFWKQHRPGDRWNCKCSLRNTDKEPTPVPADTIIKGSEPQRGLESNPGTTGEIFSDNHPYFPENCGACPFNKGVGKLFAALVEKKGDCFNHCKVIERLVSKNEWQNINPAPKFVINEEKYNELINHYDTKVSLKEIQQTSFEKFDAVRLLRIIDEGVDCINDKTLSDAWKNTHRSIIPINDNQIALKISGGLFRLLLVFGRDKYTVINKFIRIEPQNIGMGSIISLELIKQYITMGITKIKADSSLQAGGYTWARTGYYACNRKEAETVVLKKFKGKDLENAMNIIERYYIKGKKNTNEPFPMQKIAIKKYKQYLSGTSWKAELNPQTSQRKGMVRYLSKKVNMITPKRE